jgi:methionyl-tRNA synthetase
MSERKKFYITTAIDYTNDTIHIGHAFQKVIADFLARYYRIKLGESNVFFLTGTDEYGQKAEKAAKEAGISPKEFVDKIAKSDQKEQDSLNISYSRFIRTTDSDHAKVVREIWERVNKSGDIYLGEYLGLYCEGCEAYYTEEDLVNGRCSFHPTLEIRQVAEKNYFFKWSKYQNFLIEHIKSHSGFIFPETRRNEMLEFAKHIKDIPISRANFKWGIPAPNNPDQVIYVWFDALTNYLTGIGFLENPKQFEKFWPADVHILGKDNLRWHALLWPAILKSAGIDLPKTILINGFLSLNGQKISKSIGNIIRPSDWVRKFGVDAVRYYLLRYTTVTEDSDISEEKLKIAYNADLANGLGNFAARILALQSPEFKSLKIEKEFEEKIKETEKIIAQKLEEFKFNDALAAIWGLIAFGDKYINQTQVWKIADPNQKNQIISNLLAVLNSVAVLLMPFLPETGEKILRLKKGEILFPRL